MASNLRRSRRTFSQRFLTAEANLNEMRRRPAPRSIGERVVIGTMIAPSAVDFGELSPAVNNFIQATADGKNTIYRQPAAPAGGSYAVGDLWFDTDNGHALSRWELVVGVGQWVIFGLGDAAISNINAGKIATGELSAVFTLTGSLQAGTLESSKFVVNNGGMFFGASLPENATFRVTGDGQLYVGTSPNWLRVSTTGQVWTGGVSFDDAEFRIDNDGSIRIGPRRSYAISAVVPSTPAVGSVTYTLTAAHSLVAGDSVIIAGLLPAGYNGTFKVTSASASALTVANTEVGAVTDAIGTADSTALFITNSGGISIGTVSNAGQFVVQPTGQVDVGGNDATSFHIAPDGSIWTGANSTGFATAPFKLFNDGTINIANGQFVVQPTGQVDVGGNDATSFHIAPEGNIWVGAGNTGFATAPFKLSNDGTINIANGQFVVQPTGQVDVGGNDATSFHIAPDGSIWTGANNASSSTAPFKLSNDGSIDIGSTVGAASLHIAATGNVHVGATKANFASAPFSITSSSGAVKASTVTLTTTIAGARTIAGAQMLHVSTPMFVGDNKIYGTTATGSPDTDISGTFNWSLNATDGFVAKVVAATAISVNVSGYSSILPVRTSVGMGVGALAYDVAGVTTFNTTDLYSSSIQMATDTQYGGVNDQHTGYRISCGFMDGWGTSRLMFSASTNWGTYDAPSLVMSKDILFVRMSTVAGVAVNADGFGGLHLASSRNVLKERVTTVQAADAVYRIKQMRPVDFYFKQAAIGDGTNEYVNFDHQRGFIAEEMAAIGHELANWGWIDPEDELSQMTTQLIGTEISLEDAVPVMWREHSVIADLVAALQNALARIEILEG